MSDAAFYVNGVPVSKLKPSPAHNQNSKTRGKGLSKKDVRRQTIRRRRELAHRDHQPTRKLFESVRHREEMEALKHASALNKVKRVAEIAKEIAEKHFNPYSNGLTRFGTTASIFCLPDSEDRSAIYCAASNGNNDLCKLMIASEIVALSWRLQLNTAPNKTSTTRTIRGWFEHFGFESTLLTRKEFDDCVMDAPSFKTKIFLENCLCTLFELQLLLERSPWSSLLPKGVFQTKRAAITNKAQTKKKPAINFGGPLDAIDERIDADLADKEEGDSALESGAEEEQVQDELLSVESVDDYEAVEEEADDDQATSSGSSEGSHLSDWETSFLDGGLGCEVGEVAATQPTSDDWSVVSGVESVRSIDSFALSYRDALVSGPACAGPGGSSDQKAETQRPWKKEQQAKGKQSGVSKPDENCLDSSADTDLEFDADFVRDGAKLGRGGKGKLRFKGNQKTVLHRKWNWPHPYAKGKPTTRSQRKQGL